MSSYNQTSVANPLPQRVDSFPIFHFDSFSPHKEDIQIFCSESKNDVETTYIHDEVSVASEYIRANKRIYLVHQYVMRCYVSGKYHAYLNYRLPGGDLVRQERICVPMSRRSLYPSGRCPSPETFTRQERYGPLATITEDDEILSESFASFDTPSRLAVAHERDENLWLRRALRDAIAGIESQDTADVPEPMFDWFHRFNSYVRGNSRMQVPDSAIQQSLDESYDFLDKENLTLLGGFRWLVKNWRLAYDSPIGRHSVNLIGAAIACGFLPETASTHHWQTFELYRIKMESYKNLPDVIDLVCCALNYFVESAVASWDKGTFEPFLHEKTMSIKLDEAYEYVRTITEGIRQREFDPQKMKWHDILRKVDASIELHTAAISLASGGTFHRKLLGDRVSQLKAWRFTLVTLRSVGSVTKQAPSVIFEGLPGCGKTIMMQILLYLHASTFKLDFDPAYVADIVVDDAYDSMFTNLTRYVRADDVANRPIKHDPSLGVAKMLQICNNVPFVAVKAEIEDKGRVIPDIQLAVGSTNNEHLNINLVTLAPGSFTRRIVMVKMLVKPQYANSEGGVDTDKVAMVERDIKTTHFCGVDLQHLQTFTICFGKGNAFVPGTWIDQYGCVRHMEDLELDQFLECMEDWLRKQDAHQEKYVKRTNAFRTMVCPKCDRAKCICATIPDTDPDQHFEEQLDSEMSFDGGVEQQGLLLDTVASVVKSRASRYLEEQSGFLGEFQLLPSYFRLRATKGAVNYLIDFVEHDPKFQWWYWIPEDWWSSTAVKFTANLLPPSELMRRAKRARRTMVFLTFCAWFLTAWLVSNIWWPQRESVVRSLICDSVHGIGRTHILLSNIQCRSDPVESFTSDDVPFIGLACVIFLWFWNGIEYFRISRMGYTYLSKKRNVITQSAARERESYAPYIKALLNCIAIGGGLLTIVYYLKGWWNEDEGVVKEPDAKSEGKPLSGPVEEQFLFTDESDESLKKKNEVVDTWKAMCVDTKKGFRNPNMTFSQLKGIASRNLSALFKVSGDERNFASDVFWMCTGMLVIPAHLVPKKEERWLILDQLSQVTESPKTVSPANCHLVTGADFAYVYINSRSKKNLIPYFSRDSCLKSCTYLWRSGDTGQIDMELSELRGAATYDPRYTACPITIWKWPRETFKGACGGVYLSEGKHPSIVGIHIAAKCDDKTIGMSYCPDADEIQSALKFFADKPGFVMPADSHENPSRVVNGSITFNEDGAFPKRDILSATQWLKDNEKTNDGDAIQKQGAEFVGTRAITAFYKSRAVDTVIADSIKKRWPDLSYGKPRFGRSMWAKSARYAFDTTPGLPLEHLEWAYQDYMSAFKNIPPYLLEHLRPLTWDEVLNGIPGVRFIDAMKWTTSMGINFPGGKKAWTFEYLDVDSGHLKKEFLEEVKRSVEEARDKLARGLRVDWLFNATPKDEPTPTDKEKVRLFMVAEISCTILVRMYFTPICRVVQMLTSRSECAVGINCLSDDWEAMMQHLERFSNFFDGDHSKYDLRKNPILSRFSYRIMIEIASMGSYSALDLFMMSTMVDDLVSPLVNYNGEVYRLDGSTPSGIPVTVIINSIDNSLINRCAYRSVYPKAKLGEFRRYVSHINYGDDFVNSVSWYARRFNFLTMRDYMAQYGMILTPGIKDAEGRKFLADKSAVVFLQRTSAEIPGVPHRVGKLNESSIVKSLLCVLQSKHLTAEEAAATNIDGALREWAFHGADVYVERQKFLQEVATEHGIAHLCSMFHTSHQEVLDAFQEF